MTGLQLLEQGKPFSILSKCQCIICTNRCICMDCREVQFLTILKLRVGYGTSAGYPDPYQTRNTLNTQTKAFQAPSGSVINTNSISNRLGNPNLAAEKHTELGSWY